MLLVFRFLRGGLLRPCQSSALDLDLLLSSVTASVSTGIQDSVSEDSP